MKTLRFGDGIPSAEECGCGLDHDRTLQAAVIAPLKKSLGLLSSNSYAVFYDEVTFRVAGRFVVDFVDGEGFLVRAPTFSEAEEKAEKVKGFETIIGVGGGSVIDVAKYAAYKTGKTFISIPTAPSHDGIASPTASLFDKGRRISIKTRAPVLALIDLDIMMDAPRILRASGFGDIIAKIVSIKDWQLGRDEVGEPYCKTAESCTLRAVRLVVEALSKPLSRRERIESLVEALVYSGVAMMVAGSSRPASGSEHLFSHYLDMNLRHRAPHGIQCAIGALVMARYHEIHNPGWWRRPEYGWRNIRRLMIEAGIPVSLAENGIPLEIAARALVEAAEIRPNRYTILHKRRPSLEEAIQLFREVGLL